jgi:hypothetical protein
MVVTICQALECMYVITDNVNNDGNNDNIRIIVVVGWIVGWIVYSDAVYMMDGYTNRQSDTEVWIVIGIDAAW